MSGEFRPEQNAAITATDDPALAAAHGLTSFNKSTGQFEAPRSDAGVRDGEDAQAERHAAAKADGEQQHEAEHGAPVKAAPTKAAGSKK